LKDVSGDLKDVAGVEIMMTWAGDTTKVKTEVETAKNGVRNEGEKGKQRRWVFIRGYN
jgi:hypothetical protein